MTAEPEGQPALAFAELTTRRGLIRIQEEDLFRMAQVNPAGFTVLGVHADWETRSVLIMVCHPDLPVTPPGTQATVLNAEARYAEEYLVVDGELWRRSRLALDAPEVQAALVTREVS